MDIKCDKETDLFKPVFKYYKNSNEINLRKETQIIDFSDVDRQRNGIKEIEINRNKWTESPIYDHFRDTTEWKVFSVEAIEGLVVIPNILKKEFSNKLFNYLLEDLPFNESKQLKANIGLPPTLPMDESNLRWISFGYHYDWNSKLYSDSDRSPIPLLIEQLCQYMSRSLGFEGFRAEAGLINYYRQNSTLCPHSDHSEPNTRAPLFSLSLGSTAIFLIGGTTRCSTQPVIPIYLRDSDLLIMSSECRQAFHAIPKVFNDSNDKKGIKRINLNVRQVY